MTAPPGPLDRAVVVAGYRRNCAAAPPEALRRLSSGTRWDPFFQETVTLADVYAYPVAHFDFHAAQLSLDGTPGATGGPRK